MANDKLVKLLRLPHKHQPMVFYSRYCFTLLIALLTLSFQVYRAALKTQLNRYGTNRLITIKINYSFKTHSYD